MKSIITCADGSKHALQLIMDTEISADLLLCGDGEVRKIIDIEDAKHNGEPWAFMTLSDNAYEALKRHFDEYFS